MGDRTAHLDTTAPEDAAPTAVAAPGRGVRGRAEGQRTERRLAAIAFLDLVGSTRLMEHDEDGTLRHWVALRRGVIEPRVRAWRGRVVSLTGDGLLAEFRSVLDAVRWSLDVQAALSPAAAREPPLRVRIAVHMGDVVEAVDGALYGHAVNLAARLQEHAAPGGVAVSQAVHEQVRHRLAQDAEDLGGLRLKNIARPVRAFRLVPAAQQRCGMVPAVGDAGAPAAAPDDAAPPPAPRLRAGALGVLGGAAYAALSLAFGPSIAAAAVLVAMLGPATALAVHPALPAARHAWKAARARAAAWSRGTRRLGLPRLTGEQ